MPFDFKAATKLFFDRPKVRSAVDKGTRQALSKFGAFVRQRARTSIRKRKGVSQPGQPPFSHKGILRRGILFGFDPVAKSVVIGPVLAGSQSGAPETLEYSGPAQIRELVPRGTRHAASRAQAQAYGRLIREGRVATPSRAYRLKTIYVRHRPYMGPAFRAELPKVPQMFKNAIR